MYIVTYTLHKNNSGFCVYMYMMHAILYIKRSEKEYNIFTVFIKQHACHVNKFTCVDIHIGHMYIAELFTKSSVYM